VLLSFPRTKGQEATGTLPCVGTGANRTWESLWMHGLGLAQTEPGRDKAHSKTTLTWFAQARRCSRRIAVASSADRRGSRVGA
jgi:hypothetical protein